MSHTSEGQGRSVRDPRPGMERLQHVLFRVHYIALVIISSVVLLTFLDVQSTFLHWTLPSVATAAWVALTLAALFKVVLSPRLPPALRGQFTASYLAVRGAFAVVGCGVVVWVIWSAYGPL